MSDATIHASCVLLGEGAILIRGPSGSGKSTLALALIEAARSQAILARLVGDDRIRLAVQAGRLVARGHPTIEGRVEARSIGLLPVAHEAAAVVRLVIDLLEDRPDRLPEPAESTITLCGIALTRVTSRISPGLETAILARYRAIQDTLMIE